MGLGFSRKDWQWIVVELAGYEGEHDVRTFNCPDKAARWINRQYDEDDKERLHPAIRLDKPNGESTYDHGW